MSKEETKKRRHRVEVVSRSIVTLRVVPKINKLVLFT